jgi:hypothetical protein
MAAAEARDPFLRQSDACDHGCDAHFMPDWLGVQERPGRLMQTRCEALFDERRRNAAA